MPNCFTNACQTCSSAVKALWAGTKKNVLGVLMFSGLIVLASAVILALVLGAVALTLGIPALVLMLAWNHVVLAFADMPPVSFWQSVLVFWTLSIVLGVVRRGRA